jgi:hypothetical protein
MTYERAINGSVGMGAVVALAWACAGSGTPERTAEFDQALAEAYAGSQGLPPGGSGPGGGGDGGSRPNGGNGGANDGGSAGGNNEAGSGEPPPGGSGSYCDAPAVVFFEKCGGEAGFCHGPDSSNGDFAVSAATAAGALDQASANGPSCGLLIDPGNIDESIILTKVGEDTYDPDCGTRMPLGVPEPLPETDVECIRSWLSQFEE